MARGVGDVTGDLLMHTPVVGKALEGAGQAIAPAIENWKASPGGQGLTRAYGEFKSAHPEAAGNVEALGNIASVVPIFKGAQVAKRGAQSATRSTLYGTSDALVDAVSPRLGPVGRANAVAQRGTVQRGLLGVKDIAPDPKAVNAASVIRQYVPEAEKLLSKGRYLEAVNVLKTGATTLRDSYRAAAREAKGIIFPIKQYGSHLRKMEVPFEVMDDPFLMKQRNRIIDMAESIARKNGGSADKIVDTLSDFDAAIKRRYPSLYKSDRFTPLRGIVRDVRESTKDFAEKAIPDLNLREQMSAVHRILDSVDNVAKKGTSGATSEIGKHMLSDKFQTTRGLLRAGVNKAAEGSVIGGMLRLLQ